MSSPTRSASIAGVLDAALGELDDAGLIRLRGDVSTRRSSVELTDGGERALDGVD